MKNNYVIIDCETTGLNPIFDDRLTCIVCLIDEEYHTFYGEDEKKILQDFWSWIATVKNPILIGFNSYTFDHRFIVIRTMHHNLKATINLKKNYIDLMYELGFYNKFAGTLSDYGQMIGHEKNGNGLRAIELYRSGDWEHLVEYCKNDVFITQKLFERCQQAGII